MKEIDLSRMDQRERQAAKVEVEVLRCLKHPYIVRHWDHFLHDNHLCIAMDYCEGGDLAKYIAQCGKQRTPIPEGHVLRWFTQCCLALKYMHELANKEDDRHPPVLHRDIKAQNIFLAKREGGDRIGCVKIADFGISKILSTEKSLARTQVGTPYYLSPEICQKLPYGEPSDVWALGCVLYELCALHVPFEAQDLPRLFDKILRGPAPRIPGMYSRELGEIASEMLSREAGRRPSASLVLKRPIIRTEIEKMLEENKKEKHLNGENKGKRDNRSVERRDSREPLPAAPRPLGEHNPRAGLGSPRQERVPSKRRDSRAPSPTTEVAKQMLRQNRAPSSARDYSPARVPAASPPVSARDGRRRM
jgi:NIMA (never in mitosis gene a)-related kinase